MKGSKDQTVVLRTAEHPFVRWDTCVYYAQAEILSCGQLQKHIDCGTAKFHKDINKELLSLIVDGFIASDYTKKRVLEFVRAYKGSVVKAPEYPNFPTF